MISTQDAQELLPDVCGRKRLQSLHKPGKGVRFIMVTLPFHALSPGFAMIMSVFGGGVFVPGRSSSFCSLPLNKVQELMILLMPGFAHRAVKPSEIRAILNHSRVTQALFTPCKQLSAKSRLSPEAASPTFSLCTRGILWPAISYNFVQLLNS